MWSQVKKLSATVKRKMSLKADEIALEAISATQMELENDQRVPGPVPIPPGSEGDDESSIEALSWSDFDEEELEIAKELAEKEFPGVVVQEEPSSSSSNVQDNNIISTSSLSSEATTLVKESGEDSSPSSVLSSISSSQILNDIDNFSDITEIMNESVKEEDSDKKMMDVDGAMFNSTLSVTNCCGSGDGDKSSNAAVLDDGPIWGKGAKSYKFHENQKINQKLTFGVLMSIVMAIGVGLGNLVAVEFDPVKPIEQQRCPVPLHSSRIHMNTPPKNTLYEKATVSKSPDDYSSTPRHSEDSDRVDVPKTLNVADPYVISQTETLAQVVKSIDELSKKIDQFENTTRQLSGIIIMKDDLKTQKGPLVEKGHEFPNKKNTMGSEEFSRFLPTFNDDLSSWEKASGSQPPKRPDIKEGCEKLPEQNRDSFKKAAKPVSDADDDDVQIEVDDMNSDIVGDLPQDQPQVQQNKLDSQNIGKQREEPQKKQKHKQKIFAEQTDKKKKKSKGKLDWDTEQEVDHHVRQKSKGKELKVEKRKILKPQEESTEQREWNDKKKHSKKQGKDKKVKRERSMENEPEKQQTFEDGLDHEKTKNGKVKSGKEKNGSIKIKKVKRDARRKSEVKDYKDNSSYRASESLPEHNNNHKVKRSKEGNPEERTYHSGDENSEVDERRQAGKPSSKYPKYKKKNKNEYQSADQKDWTSERAKLRENQRVQQNWNSDFNGENQMKIKRKKNWQIERDRVREKIRKVDTS